jgi:5'-deoxynucleotidase YfbR-like HD superfamily hydrolase
MGGNVVTRKGFHETKGLLKKSPPHVVRDIDFLLEGFRLQRIRRYLGQPYWDEETQAARFADQLEPSLRLESVAEHSWAVADAVLLLGWRFPFLNVAHACRLAVVHDKMEIWIGDLNPLGRDGTGHKGHAFDDLRRLSKEERERRAIEEYTARLPPPLRSQYGALLIEALECRSPESRFVKSLDKMNALAFILLKKRGSTVDHHLRFLIEFTEKNNRYFPPLASHSNELLRRIMRTSAKSRGVSVARLLADVLPLGPVQLPLALEEGALADEIEALPDNAIPGKTKRQRLKEVFADLATMPPARTGVEAWARLSASLNRVEDATWGPYWQPPRFVPPGTSTDRMYPIAPDSVFPVKGWLVDVLVAEAELVFISAGGALEAQEKDRSDLLGKHEPFHARRRLVLFELEDSRGRGVWHSANRLLDA